MLGRVVHLGGGGGVAGGEVRLRTVECWEVPRGRMIVN